MHSPVQFALEDFQSIILRFGAIETRPATAISAKQMKHQRKKALDKTATSLKLHALSAAFPATSTSGRP
jgi:hypothetical protein